MNWLYEINLEYLDFNRFMKRSFNNLLDNLFMSL